MGQDEENNRQLARSVMESLDRRDVEGVVANCAEAAVWHGFSPEPLDSGGYRVAIQEFLDAFEDSRFPVVSYIAEGALVAAVHALDGTHTGSFQGVPASGVRVHVPAIVIFRMSQGRVVETWLNADLMGLLIQVGAIKLPAPA